MIKVYEIDMSGTCGVRSNMEEEINVCILKENINQDKIINLSWKNSRTLNLFVRQ